MDIMAGFFVIIARWSAFIPMVWLDYPLRGHQHLFVGDITANGLVLHLQH